MIRTSRIFLGLIACAAIVAGGVLFGQVRMAAAAPTDPEMIQTFKSLHDGVYDSFGASSEDELYDRLHAQIDEGPLLDQVFLEMRDSVLEDSRTIEIFDVNLLGLKFVERASDHFSIDCVWTVEGRITHWTHTHDFMNAYHATYTAIRKDGGWKLSEMKLVNKRRDRNPYLSISDTRTL